MDYGCTSSTDNSEQNPECSDSADNDTDGATDYPADPHCSSYRDNNEDGNTSGSYGSVLPKVAVATATPRPATFVGIIDETITIENIDITKGIIMGRACNDANSNGICEGNEVIQPLEPLTITLLQNGLPVATTQTHPTFGSWAIGNLAAGTYTVIYPSDVTYLGNTYLLKTEPITVTLVPLCDPGTPASLCAVSWSGYNDAGFSIDNDCYKIQATYFKDYNRNGIRDATNYVDEFGNNVQGVIEPPVSGMAIEIVEDGINQGSVATDAEGNVWIDVNLGSTYDLLTSDKPTYPGVNYFFTTATQKQVVIPLI